MRKFVIASRCSGTAYPDKKVSRVLCVCLLYDRIFKELAQRQRLGHALLADVMAHEIGHLLLGSTSHFPRVESCAGIGDYEQLRNVS